VEEGRGIGNVMKVGIYINSANRADNVLTIRQFPIAWKKFTHIVVPGIQAASYEHHGWPVLALPKTVPSFLSPQRQWVMGNAKHDFVWLMDDDLSFDCRYDGIKLRKSNNEEMNLMLSDVLKLMEKYPLVGISGRYGNNHVPERLKENCKVTRCYCVNKSVFLKEKFNLAPFDAFVMEDLAISLAVLEAGYPSCVLHDYAQGDKARNTPGGCSVYRTLDVQEKSAKCMVATHPGIVQIQMKKRKHGWGKPIGDSGEVVRTGVKVSWRFFKKGTRDKTVGIRSFL
jgi:hypothetical protein